MDSETCSRAGSGQARIVKQVTTPPLSHPVEPQPPQVVVRSTRGVRIAPPPEFPSDGSAQHAQPSPRASFNCHATRGRACNAAVLLAPRVYASVTRPVTDVYADETYSQLTAHETHGKEVRDEDGHRGNRSRYRHKPDSAHASRRPNGTPPRIDGAGHGRARIARPADGARHVIGAACRGLRAPRSRTDQEHARRHAPPHAVDAGAG